MSALASTHKLTQRPWYWHPQVITLRGTSAEKESTLIINHLSIISTIPTIPFLLLLLSLSLHSLLLKLTHGF